MSYTIIQSGNRLEANLSKKVFQIDAEADLASLPECAPGTIAYTNDMSKIWNKSNDGSWARIV